MAQMTELFEAHGATFCTSTSELKERLKSARAFLFDWDGVFNNGIKQRDQHTSFSEADAMGTNLLRFGHRLRTGELPVMGIITGEDNVTARYLATREHYHFVYSQSKDKAAAFHHFLSMTSLTPEQVVYVFDDVSDLAVAEQCGIRFLIYRRASPCFLDFTTRHHLVDYIAAQEGGAHAVREVCELILAFTDMYDEAVTHRYRYSDIYKLYWKERQSIETSFYQPGYQGNLVLSEQHQNIA